MCVFCKIAKKEFSSNIIFEDDICLAILDLSQATTGHTLVIPKKHFDNIYSIDDETIKHLFGVVKKICCHYKKVIPNLAGINILNNNEAKAGQTVMHYHIHIIPRYINDDLTDMKFIDHSKEFDYLEILNKIKMAY